MYLYATASQTTVSATIVREEGNVQQPIYFVSRILIDAKTRYSLIEKTTYVVVVAARKLKPYFDVHQIIVLTDLPLEKSLDKIERSGRLAKWAVELNGYGIKYQARIAIKGQALADIFTKCTHNLELKKDIAVWQLLTNGSSRNVGAGAVVVLISPERKTIE